MPDKRRRVAIYSEAFCPLSETFVYRLATLLEMYKVSVLTHERLNLAEFPDEGLEVVVRSDEVPRRLTRILKGAWNSLRWGVPSAQVLSPSDAGVRRLLLNTTLVFAQFATCGFRILPAAIRFERPVVTMFHGCDLGSWLRFPRYRACLRALFDGGAAFIVATEFMRRRALDLGCPADRLHRIPYPIPLGPASLPAHEGAVPTRRFRFIHVGRLHEQKGILYSIRAFAEVNRRRPDSEFVVIGDGPQRHDAEALVGSLGLSAKVAFLGALPFREVDLQLRKADAYVIHSVTTSDGDTEGFGVSLAEASERCLPVVATAHNGFPDVIDDGVSGFLVPEGDWEKMAEAMNELAGNRALARRLGAAGHELVHTRFAPSTVAEAYRRLFDRIALPLPHA